MKKKEAHIKIDTFKTKQIITKWCQIKTWNCLM